MLGGLRVITADRTSNRQPHAIRVLAALFGETPEAALLRQAVRPPASLHTVSTRAGVLAALHGGTHDVIVFPLQDQDRVPTAPLIRAWQREQPGATILLLCGAPPPRSAAILAAARAGAQVLMAPTVFDISSLLTRIKHHYAHDLVPSCESLEPVQPPLLLQLLCAASQTVRQDGSVRTLAHHLHVSTRTISRYTRRAVLAPPAKCG